jgi:tetratricopeptide (TPR) repeat protein
MSQPPISQLQQQALHYLNQNKIAAAITTCEQILKLDAEFAPAYKMMGTVFQLQGKQEIAKSYYKKALEYQPQFPEVYANLGSLYAKEENWESAISAYENAIQLQPQMAGLYRNLARIFSQTNQLDKATAYWYKAFQLEPDWGTAEEHLTLGNRLFKQQQLAAAKHCYQQALQQQPNYAEAYHNLGEVASKTHEFEQAASYYQSAIDLNYNALITYQRLAETWSQLKQWKKAITVYQQAVQLFPNSFETYQKLAQLLQQQQCHEQAIAAYLKAIQLKPYFLWSYLNLWQYLAKHDQLETALQYYQVAVEQLPNVPLVELNLAEILTRLGKLETATHHYQQATYKKLKQSYPEIVKQYWSSEQVLSPQFIIIGTQKGGTTSLYRYLEQHPQIFPAIRKEIYFWNYHYHRGLDWYLSHFPCFSTEQHYLTGEASPNYLEDKQTPERLFQVFPQMKFIVLLRNPVDRAVSQYHHWIRLNREQQSLETAFQLELEWLTCGLKQQQIDPRYWTETSRYLWRGCYILFLRRWMKVFPPEQFLILRSEDFYHSPELTLNKVFEFLNLPQSSEIDFKPYNQGFYQPISEEIRHQLHQFFTPYNQKLEAFLGMKFDWNSY